MGALPALFVPRIQRKIPKRSEIRHLIETSGKMVYLAVSKKKKQLANAHPTYLPFKVGSKVSTKCITLVPT